MVEFKVNVGDPESGRTFPVEVTGQHANVLVRKQIGEEVDGMFLGLPGYKVQITGGTDKDGFPMRPEFSMAGRKRVLVSKSVGFRPTERGVRRKLTFRGNEVSPEIVQINCKVTKRGPKPITQHLGLEDQPAVEEETAPEEPAEEAAEEEAEEAADEEVGEEEAAEEEPEDEPAPEESAEPEEGEEAGDDAEAEDPEEET